MLLRTAMWLFCTIFTYLETRHNDCEDYNDISEYNNKTSFLELRAIRIEGENCVVGRGGAPVPWAYIHRRQSETLPIPMQVAIKDPSYPAMWSLGPRGTTPPAHRKMGAEPVLPIYYLRSTLGHAPHQTIRALVRGRDDHFFLPGRAT